MFGKAILQVVVAVIMALIGFLDDNVLDTVEIINATLVGLTAITVAVIPNLDQGIANIAKVIVAMLTAGFTVLVTAVSAGVDMTEWLQVIVAVLGAAGIYLPKAPQHPMLALPRGAGGRGSATDQV